MQGFDKIRKLNVVGHMDSAEIAAEEMHIFIAGPFIDVSKSADVSENCETSAKRLRYFLGERLRKGGNSIYLGEDYELRLKGEKVYRHYSNAVLHERHMIKKYLDAIIAIPASPGSFCEIGDWVSDKSICSKMLIILEDRFQNDVSYINHGVIKFAKVNGASVVYTDFSHLEHAFEMCTEFCERISELRRIEALYDRA